MKRVRNINPLILIIGASLIIVLALALIYILNQSEQNKNEDVIEELPELQPVGMDAEPDAEGWRSLFNGHTLDGWEITNFGPQGPVNVRDSSIILNFGDGSTGVNWTGDFPVINYEISLEAMRIDGHDIFSGITFPVEDSHATFIIGGWAGSVVGISSIDGLDASENFTSTRMAFDTGRWYNIRLRVDEEAITGYIDDEQVVYVPMGKHNIHLRSGTSLSTPLGLVSWSTTAALRNIKFRIRS